MLLLRLVLPVCLSLHLIWLLLQKYHNCNRWVTVCTAFYMDVFGSHHQQYKLYLDRLHCLLGVSVAASAATAFMVWFEARAF